MTGGAALRHDTTTPEIGNIPTTNLAIQVPTVNHVEILSLPVISKVNSNERVKFKWPEVSTFTSIAPT